MVTNKEGSTMIEHRNTRRPLALGAAAALLAAACAGEGKVQFSEISGALSANCAHCHDSDATKRATLLDAVAALPDPEYNSTSFPISDFVIGLRNTTALDHKNGLPAEHPEAAVLTGDEPREKAWILHELYEQDGLLAEPVPPDYTTQARFDAFVTLGNPGAYGGCTMGEKLDLGNVGDPEGMSPLWAPKLRELLVGAGQTEHQGFRPITADERQKIRDYVDQLLPGGLRSCTPGTGEGS